MLKQLETLIAIADSGSFHAAAERMFITQSAVSMQMKSPEEMLQLEIFDRSVRPPHLSNTAHLMRSRPITCATRRESHKYYFIAVKDTRLRGGPKYRYDRLK